MNDRRNNKSILVIAITKHKVKRLSSVLLEKYWPPIFSEQTIHAPTIYFWKPRGRIDHLFFFFFLNRYLSPPVYSSPSNVSRNISRPRRWNDSPFIVSLLLNADSRMWHGTRNEEVWLGEVFCWNNHLC